MNTKKITNIYKDIKENTFLHECLKAWNNSETALDFDFWGAVWIISVLVQRNFLLVRPTAPLFPNFYILFIAESGIARKSFAVTRSKYLLQNIVDNYDDLNVITAQTTPQKFNILLTKSSIEKGKSLVNINCSEFITLFKNKSIIEFFTDIFDCPNERKGHGSISHGEINIRNLYATCLAASTPNYYFKAITKEEVEGGFTSRCIIVPAEKGKRKIAWGYEYDQSKLIKLGKKLVDFIQQQPATREVSTKAIQRYSQWYLRKRSSGDLFTRNFEAREQDHVLKLACLLSLNDFCNKIEEQHINLAIKIIQNIKKKAQKFINKELTIETNDTMTKIIERIRDIIHSKAENGIIHRELYLRVHNSCTSDEFNYIINTMHELGMIEKLQPYKRKAVIYRETKNLYKIDIKNITKMFNM